MTQNLLQDWLWKCFRFSSEDDSHLPLKMIQKCLWRCFRFAFENASDLALKMLQICLWKCFWICLWMHFRICLWITPESAQNPPLKLIIKSLRKAPESDQNLIRICLKVCLRICFKSWSKIWIRIHFRFCSEEGSSVGSDLIRIYFRRSIIFDSASGLEVNLNLIQNLKLSSEIRTWKWKDLNSEFEFRIWNKTKTQNVKLELASKNSELGSEVLRSGLKAEVLKSELGQRFWNLYLSQMLWTQCLC